MDDLSLILDLYYLELKYYKKELEFLENSKPFKIFKKKNITFEIKRKELLNKIDECNKKIKNVIDDFI